MSGSGADMQLSRGLASTRAHGLAALVADVTGHKTTSLPWLAPALLMSDPAVQAGLEMPQPETGDILVQEYQSIDYPAAFPLDTDLTGNAQITRQDALTDYRFTLSDAAGPVAQLGTALRRVPTADLGAIKPTPFRTASLGDSVGWSVPFSLTQPQTDRYLSLSGDPNPIHRDPALTRQLGLDAPIVPGLLLVALIQPYVGAALPGHSLQSLKARFLAPLCMDAPLRIGIQPRALSGNLQKARAYLVATDERALAIVDLTLNFN